ncbi:nuclear receptor coactivator 5 [Macrosteles quadrilineatus]|uniref:nuclear receptor coactivator 5 n=1 Tax=Macrosteles quadrilineatus TaxID=74068 RepID=UPI0023E34DF4|nr:nuclear receptor coactivator 5 [Macrosteles quadrilineatus]
MSFNDRGGGPSKQELFSVMNDPNTVGARIFIGNIPTKMERPELEEKFSFYGKIIGLIPKNGFAFIQYDSEQAAADAIANECGKTYYGRKIDVKAATQRKEPGGNRGPPPPQHREDVMDRDRSPIRGGPGDRGRDWRENDRFDSPGFGGHGGGRGGRGGRPGPESHMDRFPEDDFRGPPGDFRGPRDDFRGPPEDLRGIPDLDRDFNGPPRGRGLPADYPPVERGPPPALPDRTNDCEIIVVNKMIREYAEFIERRLIKIGLTVDLLFPNEEVPLGRVLANISGRGTLFAIIVNITNEEHRSLTLNILYGQPQEHRNMPLEDALAFIARSFDAYLRGERGQGPGPVSVGQPDYDKHPEAIQTLLNLLRENRQLTVLQYDKVIKYLQDRREVQIKLEVGDAQGLPSIAGGNQPPTTKQQAELQHRILNILNQSGGQGGGPPPQPVSSPWNQQQSASSAPAPLLNDPTVQKALDSLIQGDLLKKINPGAPGPVRPPQQPLFGAYAGGRR